ncbi:hypothetical protein WDW86_05600 [Bdellovibrionota bacterium FG-2]
MAKKTELLLDAERYSDNEFETRVKSPRAWLERAETLLRSGRHLERQCRALEEKVGFGNERIDCTANADFIAVQESHRLLMGYAVEACLKGLWVDLKPEGIIVRPNGDRIHIDFPWKKAPHDLISVAKHVGMPCVDADAWILRVLSRQILWQAKYPAPRSTQGELVNTIGGPGCSELHNYALGIYSKLFNRILSPVPTRPEELEMLS